MKNEKDITTRLHLYGRERIRMEAVELPEGRIALSLYRATDGKAPGAFQSPDIILFLGPEALADLFSETAETAGDVEADSVGAALEVLA